VYTILHIWVTHVNVQCDLVCRPDSQTQKYTIQLLTGRDVGTSKGHADSNRGLLVFMDETMFINDRSTQGGGGTGLMKCVHRCVYVCVHACVNICVRACMYMRVCISLIYMYVCTLVYVCAFVCVWFGKAHMKEKALDWRTSEVYNTHLTLTFSHTHSLPHLRKHTHARTHKHTST